MPKYSICITHYNNKATVEDSLNSILGQISSDFEIVVVDSKSSDGSAGILRDYARQGRMKLVERKCSRGVGREIALENATGDYVISGLDMDDIFKRTLGSLLRFYHEKAEGNLLTVINGETTMVSTRQLLTTLGGWRDLQFRENWELSRRAARDGKHRWTIFPIVTTITSKQRREKSFRSRIGYQYTRYRDNLRVGHKQFDKEEAVGLQQRMVWFAARFSILFLPRYTVDYSFTSVDPNDFVDSREYWPKDDDIWREREIYRALLKQDI